MTPRPVIAALVRRGIVIFCALSLLGACGLQPERVAPILKPRADSPVWPLPPESPRYAYVGTLIGERNFIADKEATNSTKSFLAWVVGIILGKTKYKELRRPVSGMVDQQGRILVVDASYQGLVVFDMNRKQLDVWTRAAEGQGFSGPVAVCESTDHIFWVTDAERGEVFGLDATGKPLRRFGAGILKRPTGIACDPRDGSIYVADTRDHNIKIFDSAGRLVDIIGQRGNQPGTFNAPTHLALRGSQLYVADTLNFRVQIFDVLGDHKLSFGKIGLFVGNLTRPKGIAVGGGGRIYVIESYYDHLLVHDRDGRFLMAIGGTGQDVGAFYLPSGVWTDIGGHVYVADMFNGRVSVFEELTGGDLR